MKAKKQGNRGGDARPVGGGGRGPVRGRSGGKADGANRQEPAHLDDGQDRGEDHAFQNPDRRDGHKDQPKRHDQPGFGNRDQRPKIPRTAAQDGSARNRAREHDRQPRDKPERR